MKRSYHTDIILQYKLGILPKEYLKEIPSSTLNNWKNRDISKLIGFEHSDAENNSEMVQQILKNKRMLKIAKGLYLILQAYEKIFEHLPNKKTILRKSKNIIITTIDNVKESLGFKRVLKMFDITYQRYYTWKSTMICDLSTINLCRKKYYNQLTTSEISVIMKYLKQTDYLHWNITPLYYKILRDSAAFFSKTTFYKYVKKMKLSRKKIRKINCCSGLRADFPKKILHADVTIFKTRDHIKSYIYLIVDNFSRYIMGYRISVCYSAKIAFENLKEVYAKYDLTNTKGVIKLITDGGSENRGHVEKFVNSPDINMRQLVAQKDIIFSNSMVESVNKRLKYDFLYHQNFNTHSEVETYITKAIAEYNNKPHSSLYGLTPYEVFHGMRPDKNIFKNDIRNAIKERKLMNLNPENCKNCI